MDAKSAYLYIMKLKIQYGACLTDVYHWLSAIYEIHGIIDINEIYAESIQGVSAYPYVRPLELKNNISDSNWFFAQISIQIWN